MEIRLEGTNKSIELNSCKAGEFERVWDQALRYMQATGEDACREIVREIVEAWAPSLNPDELTMDDVWNILLAKAGKAKSPTLAKIPDLAAEAVGFLGEKGLVPVIQSMEKTILEESGDDTSQG